MDTASNDPLWCHNWVDWIWQLLKWEILFLYNQFDTEQRTALQYCVLKSLYVNASKQKTAFQSIKNAPGFTKPYFIYNILNDMTCN